VQDLYDELERLIIENEQRAVSKALVEASPGADQEVDAPPLARL
jgi:hypothetical protein